MSCIVVVFVILEEIMYYCEFSLFRINLSVSHPAQSDPRCTDVEGGIVGGSRFLH